MPVLLIFLLSWALVFIFVKFIETLTSGRLSLFLESRNVTLKFGYISFYTTHYNSAIQKLALSRRPLFVAWFGYGVILGFFLFILSAFLLVSNVLHALPSPIAPQLPIPAPNASDLLASRRPRIPFMHRQPWFLPSHWYNFFIPSDHLPSAVLLAPHQPNLFEAVSKWRIKSYNHGLDEFEEQLRTLPKEHPCDKDEADGRKFRREAGRVFASHSRNATIQFARWFWDRKRRMRMRRRFPRRRGRGRGRWGGRGRFFGRRFPPPPHHPHPPHFVDLDDQFDHPQRRHPPPPHPPPFDGEDDQRPDDDNPPPHHHFRHDRENQPPPFENPLRRRLLALPPNSVDTDTGSNPVNENESERERENHNHSPPSPSSSSSGFLTPLVPGVTVPADDIWYMLIAVLVAGVVHELGHAFAAGAEHGEVSGIGAFIALLLPGAYVRLCGIDDMSPKSQLRVYCAGAWHNVVTGLLALVVLFFLPLFTSPLYGTGALVVDVPKVSPLFGFLNPGDRILKLGKFPVHNGGDSFRGAVAMLNTSKDSIGFCVPVKKLAVASKDHMECCSILSHPFPSFTGTATSNSSLSAANASDNNSEAYSPVDEYFDSHDDSPLHKDGSICYEVASLTKRRVCAMPELLEPFDMTCRTASECPSISSRGSVSSSVVADFLPQRQTCVKPIPSNDKQLIDVLVHTAANRTHVHYFYEGYPTILGQGVTVSSYVPRFWHFLPHFILHVLAVSDLPNAFERLLQYFSSISFGLAIMNMAPVLYLDGQATVALFVRIFFKRYPTKKIRRISATTLTIGSTLLALNMLLSIVNIGKG